MAQEQRDHRIVLKEEEGRKKLLEGAKRIKDTVGTTYGPRGQQALLEKPFGRAVLTRDGVTVARDTYFKERAVNMGAQVLLEASETTNRIAGDGTSCSVVFGYYLMKYGNLAINAGMHPMEVKDTLLEDREILLKKLQTLSTPIKKGQLTEVATVSSGDPLLGQLIAEAIEYVGQDGGILTEKSFVQEVEREYVDGYYLQNGFEALQSGKKEIIKPHVIVSTRRLSSAQDAIEILNKAAETLEVKQGTIPRFLFIGSIEEQAYHTIVNTINQGVIDAVIIKTPAAFGAMSKQLLEDIAIYADCETIDDSTNLQDFDERYLGSVDKVVATKGESTMFADNTGETILDRIADIKKQMDIEISDAIIEKLKDRIAKLEGKIALFRIGGATDTSKEEKEFRIEDAIQASKAAYSDGVVDGGGVTLLELSKEKISEISRKALRSTFQQLLKNANLPAEVKLDEALKAPKGFGFNLRKGDELVSMRESGVLDPTLVVKETIKNATQAAADALTAGVVLIFEDREEK